MFDHNIPTKPLIVSVVGSALEFYDFALFGFLASTFSPLYFPVNDTRIVSLLAFSTFAVGFLTKPLGGILFGHIGDRLGRRTALCWSLSGMGVATLMLGVLPTYQTIGITASVLVIAARLQQGLSTGGELAGGILFVTENSHEKKKGLAVSLAFTGAYFGIFLGSFAAYICSLDKMPVWSWRIPFILGGLIAFVGLYARLKLSETKDFNLLQPKNIHKIPLIAGIKKMPMHFFYAVCLTSYICIFNFTLFIYLPVLIQTTGIASESLVKLCTMLNSGIVVISVPIFGFFSDIWDCRHMIVVSLVLSSVILVGLIAQITLLPLWGIIFFQMFLALCIASLITPVFLLFVNMFPIEVRYSCLALSDNIGIVIGGITPLIAALLYQYTNSTFAFICYLTLFACIAIIGILKLGMLLYKENLFCSTSANSFLLKKMSTKEV